MLSFVRNGGRIQIICSPALDDLDAEQIAFGYARRTDILAQTLRAEFDALLADQRTNFGARTLATLIALGHLELKLAVRADGRGIYHEKLGVFADTLGNRVSFKGSANETWSGWHNMGNFESIEVFCSWRGGVELTRVKKHTEHFQQLWSERDPHVFVAPFPPTVEEYMKRYAARGVENLLDEPVTRTSAKRSALPHQVSAIQAWEANGRRGVLEHATGSGKTFTAIIAIRKHVAEGNPAIILVPSKLLLEQWAKEVRDEIPEATMMLAGAGYDRWKATRRLGSMTANDDDLGPRIIIAMMPTAATAEFRESITQGDHLLVVADEVHQWGSRRNSEFFSVAAGARLGLSATPQRYGDQEGTARLFGYFGPIIPPPITLVDAVAAGRLVPYEYHPHTLNLSAAEADDWLKATKLIKLEMARQKDGPDGRRVFSERAKMLLIKRARIAKKASAKIRLASQIIHRNFEDGQSWLVYCEDSGQLKDVLESLRQIGLSPVEYHSAMAGDRNETMAWFRSYGGILVSIKCLDEGVDIPAVSHALILASSQNPRQFIQRRGRVLRHAPGKHIAVIHDAIVVPINSEKEPEQISLLKAELLRSLEFASHSINKNAGAELRSIAATMDLDVDSLIGIEVEEEDDV
ncbi:DEAD/DEAH box helicase family protein [Bosea sp. (in: a-proteobacteria)]|uniref:DEAD/DEAH box helicase family protein n=1 Tax=Bosea sp. (in: a-proteobacteria) TaxID=1871050 RepID=UPI003526B757